MRTVAVIVAVLLAIAAAIGVRSYMKRQERDFNQKLKVVKVAVAKVHVGAGEVLARDMVAYADKQSAFLEPTDITGGNLGNYVGRKLERDVGKGTPLKSSFFVSREKKPASKVLQEGKRAITLAVDITSGVAGLVRPGDNVDIYATTSARAGGTPRTWLVLSQVNVLAVDDRMSDITVGQTDYRGYRRGYSSFTLSVTSLEAQVLIYLQDYAQLTFALRPRTELGQKGGAPVIDGGNVEQYAGEANKDRQREIRELDVMRPRPEPATPDR